MRKIDKDYLAKLRERNALIADIRSPEYFRNGSIKGAVNLPYRNLINTLLKTDKKTPVIIMGGDFEANDMRSAANYAEQLGFHKIFLADYIAVRDE